MRHQHQRAGKIEEIFFQNFERRNIEVVGRLIEQQNIRRLQHQFCNQYPRPLAAGEIPHRLVQLLAGKQEACGPTCHMHLASLMHHRVAFRSQSAAQGQAFVQLAHLAEVDHAQCIGAADGAFSRVNFTAQKSQQRGLAAAVGTHQPHLHARRQNKVEPRKETPSGQNFTWVIRRFRARHIAGHIFEFHQPFSLALAGVKVDADGRNRGPRVHVL